jgi:hypothetical protein
VDPDPKPWLEPLNKNYFFEIRPLVSLEIGRMKWGGEKRRKIPKIVKKPKGKRRRKGELEVRGLKFIANSENLSSCWGGGDLNIYVVIEEGK